MTQLFPPDCECITEIHAQLDRLAKIREGTPLVQFVRRLSKEVISTFVETAFWCSLESNEGRMTHVRLFIGSPQGVPGATRFASPLAYDASGITKLAPALPPDHYLGVEQADDRLSLWGFTQRLAVRAIETIAAETANPGKLRVDVGPFHPFAVLDGRSNQILAAAGFELAHYLQGRLNKKFPETDILETQAIWRECLALADLVRMILTTGRGGALLIVPSVSDDWPKSLSSFPYRYASPDTTVRDVIRAELSSTDAQGKLFVDLLQAPLSEELKTRVGNHFPRSTWGGATAAMRAIAPITCIDGAVVLTRDLELLGFGAKIQSRLASDVTVVKFQAKPGPQQPIPCQLEDLGGTRHQSAARFVAENKAALAIVVSQDRHISVMNWDESLSALCVVRNAEWWV